MDSNVIYFDNAATSWPKPAPVVEAMVRFMQDIGANPGRSGHRRSIEAGRVVYQAREAVAELLGAPDPLRVVFGANVTDALNLALHGYLRPGDHVVTSSMEHNSIMRPLRTLEAGRGIGFGHGQRIELTVVPCSPQGFLDPADLEAALRPNTVLIVLNHASNVCGTLLPVAEAGQLARRHGCLLLVDAAQTAGAFPIDVVAMNVDLLAFTGHKALFGPTGTGGLVIGERVDLARLRPLRQGGTGSRSERQEHPDFLPDLCESGTPNAVGLAGLLAGVRWVQARGVDAIRRHEVALTRRLLDGLAPIPGVTLWGGRDPDRQVATVALTIAGITPSEIGERLDDEFGIMTRAGLHCAPAAHQTLGTFPQGTARLGLGAFNTEHEVDVALDAITRLAHHARELGS